MSAAPVIRKLSP